MATRQTPLECRNPVRICDTLDTPQADFTWLWGRKKSKQFTTLQYVQTTQVRVLSHLLKSYQSKLMGNKINFFKKSGICVTGFQTRIRYVDDKSSPVYFGVLRELGKWPFPCNRNAEKTERHELDVGEVHHGMEFMHFHFEMARFHVSSCKLLLVVNLFLNYNGIGSKLTDIVLQYETLPFNEHSIKSG